MNANEARILTYADADQARRLVAADPVANVFVGSRIDAGVLTPIVSGTLWGWPGDAVESMLHIGANMVPVAAGAGAIEAFAQVAGRRRRCRSIIGPAGMVLPLWRALGERWGRTYSLTREVRPRQSVMALSGPPRVAADPQVRPIGMADFESYVAASLAMYAEEVGGDPTAGGMRDSYRQHCRWMVEQGRAFGVVVRDRVVFKADRGASSGGVAQVQGVWLDPAFRGRGLSAGAVAAVAGLILPEFPTVSLYANDYNVRALRTYTKVGFQTVGEFATVLY